MMHNLTTTKKNSDYYSITHWGALGHTEVVWGLPVQLFKVLVFPVEVRNIEQIWAEVDQVSKGEELTHPL